MGGVVVNRTVRALDASPHSTYPRAMGRYDDISDERLRAEVARFARILQRMEDRSETLDRTADILKLLGELRRMVFAWEVRCTFSDEDHDDRPRGTPKPRDLDQAMTLSERIVAEARRREQELREEFEHGDEQESDAE